jgi:hypothetical protein
MPDQAVLPPFHDKVWQLHGGLVIGGDKGGGRGCGIGRQLLTRICL